MMATCSIYRISACTPSAAPNARAGLPLPSPRRGQIVPPTGTRTADSDGGREGRDASGTDVNAGRIMGARAILANLVNVAGGGLNTLPRPFHDFTRDRADVPRAAASLFIPVH